MKLSPHFTLEEACFSQTAIRHGWDNTPPPEILQRMKDVTAPGMEKVRALFGLQVLISSWYRCPKLNTAIGSTAKSAHQWGWAVDWRCPAAGSPLTCAKRVADSDIEFDQLIHEHGTWVHISFDPRLRGQVLTIDPQGTRPGLLPVRGG